VFGLAGFGIGLVSLAALPFVMSPATAVVLVTLYALLCTVTLFVPLRRDFVLAGMPALLLGTVAGTPLGVWLLATLPATVLSRLIGLVLVLVVALEWLGAYPERLPGRRWGWSAGIAAGIMGGAVGTPGPPVVLYVTSQGWPPRTIKANLQLFFVVNQAVILAGYWWAGLFTREVARLSAAFAIPAAVGLVLGMRLFDRVDQARFRTIVFALLFVSGLALLARG
jgi:uncharacterized membrane protein YfcA